MKFVFDKYGILHSLLALYILFAGFTDAFAITPIISIPIILIVVIFLYLLFGIRKVKIFELSITDLMFLLFLGIVFMSYISSVFFLGFHPKALNHLFAYTFSIIFLYFVFKLALQQMFCKRQNYFERIIAWFYYATFTIAIYTIIEYILRNFFSINIDNFIPHASFKDYNALSGEFFRARGTVVESGHLAFFFELFGPIGCYYCFFVNNSVKTLTKWLYGFSLFIAFMLTFSTIGYLILALSLGFLILKSISFKIKKQYFISFLVGFVVLLIVGLSYYDFISELMQNTVIDKFFSGSAEVRNSRLGIMLNVFLNGSFMQILVGFGPGAYDSIGIESVINLYPNILFETGILGLLLFLLALFSSLWSILGIKNKEIRIVFLISFMAGCFHYLAINNYYYPWIWTIIGLASIAKPYINCSKEWNK